MTYPGEKGTTVNPSCNYPACYMSIRVAYLDSHDFRPAAGAGEITHRLDGVAEFPDVTVECGFGNGISCHASSEAKIDPDRSELCTRLHQWSQ